MIANSIAALNKDLRIPHQYTIHTGIQKDGITVMII
jgi:hypothetical protein